MKKKHAYLIMAHSDQYLLEKLLELLDYELNDIYIHIDKKTKEIDVKKLQKGNFVKKSNLYFVPRINNYWGHVSQIKCELMLIESALNNGNYEYFHLISGSDLPLVPQRTIHDFFDENSGLEFVGFANLKCNDKSILERINKKHFFIKGFRSKNKIVRIISYRLHQFIVNIQWNATIDATEKFYKGAQWFSITQELAQKLTGAASSILKRYKYSYCSDELFLQTFVMENGLSGKLYQNGKPEFVAIKRFIDWNRGMPYIFRETDFEQLINSDYFWARKFSSKVDRTIIDKIYAHILYGRYKGGGKIAA